MSDYYHIIKRPLVTERSHQMKAQDNTYVFEVDRRANKPQIQQAVEELFRVDVVRVRTAVLPGKLRRLGNRKPGYRPDWKKAMVTVKAGQEIKMVEEGR